MALKDRYAGPAEVGGSRTFSCPDYEPLPGTRRCRHYIAGGPCARPDHFMCEEWLAANGHATPAAPAPAATAAGTEGSADPGAPAAAAVQNEVEPRVAVGDLVTPPTGRATDLFGQPVDAPPARPPSRTPAPAPPAPASRQPAREDVPLVRNVTDKEIASFRALGAEVCLATEQCGQVWLVPEYTGRRDRAELRIDHAATLTAICAAFPGAKVVAFRKEPGLPPAQEPPPVPPG